LAEHVQRLLPAVDAEKVVDQVLCSRRLRSGIFGAGLFSDPAWDILLTLFLSELRRETLSEGLLAEAACLSPATTARWLHALVREGLVQRHPEADRDQGLTVGLTKKGSSGMRLWLAQWLNCQCEPAIDARVGNLLQRIMSDETRQAG